MEAVSVLLAGLLATTVMIAVMSLIHRLSWANADMIRAIGSLYSRSYEMSVVPGLVIHYSAGLSFALLYSCLIAIAPVDGGGGVVILSLLAGLVHGLMVSLFLAVLVAEHHPLREFRDASFGVLAAHGVGHVFYGGTLGLFFALTQAKQVYLTKDFPFAVAHQLGTIIGFGTLWLVLFGMPLIFASYVLYTVVTARFRRAAHEADVGTGHDSEAEHPLSKIA